jgi:outer membrane murein-binding lipoprotein Lpp
MKRLLLAVLLCGCASHPKPANVPSTVGVKQQIQAAQANIEAASAAVKAAGGDNSQLQSLAERLEHKGIVIDRYFETTGEK